MKLSKNPYKKSIILGLILFVPLLLIVISGIVSQHQTRIALQEAEQETFIEWFGVSETAHQYALTWEESGLLGLEILNQEQVDKILDSDRFKDRSRWRNVFD